MILSFKTLKSESQKLTAEFEDQLHHTSHVGMLEDASGTSELC